MTSPEQPHHLDKPEVVLSTEEYGCIKMLLEDADNHSCEILEIIERAHSRNDPAAIAAAARAEGAREERDRVLTMPDDGNIGFDETLICQVFRAAIMSLDDNGSNFDDEIFQERLKKIWEALRSQQPRGEDGGAGK